MPWAIRIPSFARWRWTSTASAGCKYLILKLGERGIITYRTPDPNVRSFFTIDSFAEHVVDAVGAGDALLAYSTLALVVTQDPVIASILGSVAAALACERDGNNPIGPEGSASAGWTVWRSMP